MAQFLNQEADPKVKDSAKAADTLPPEPARINYDDATDLGLNAIERATIMAEAKTPAVTAGESFTAGMGNSIMATALRKLGAPSFDTDYNFNAQNTLYKDSRVKAYAPNQDEITYLHHAVSAEDYEYRVEQMLANRHRQEEANANPIAGIAGSVLGDAPFMVMPYAAAGVGGRMGLALRTAIRAADVTTTAYASDQLGMTNTVLALVAGASGVDELFDISKTAKALRAAKTGAPVHTTTDTAAPTFRNAADADLTATAAKATPAVEDIYSKTFGQSIQVAKGNLTSVRMTAKDVIPHLKSAGHLNKGAAAILDQIQDIVKDVPVDFRADPNVRSAYRYMTTADLPSDGYVVLRASKGSVDKTWATYGDVMHSLDADTSNVLVHELVHAATSVALTKPANAAIKADLEAVLKRIAPVISETNNSAFKYYGSNVQEMLAGLANSPEWTELLSNIHLRGEKTVLQQIGEYIMKALGFSGDDTALAATLSGFEDLLKYAHKEADTAIFRSDAMASVGEFTSKSVPAQAESMLNQVKNTLKTSFSLYDNIAQGNKDLADLLVSDGAAVGARKASVIDFKRNLTLEMDAAASIVDDAIVSQLKAQGVGFMDRFFQRSAFKQARATLEDRVVKYLDDAYTSELNGLAITRPAEDIAPIIKAYKESGWAGRWFDHIKASGLDTDTSLKRSDYYFPRAYSYDKMRQGIMSQGLELKHYRGLFRESLRDIYPGMETEVVDRVAKDIVDGIYNGHANKGPMWTRFMSGMSNDELIDAMKQAGVDEDTITAFINANTKDQGATTTARNLRQRNRFNMTKEYVVDGKVMRLADLMDTDVAHAMHGYTNRMSGRVGLAYAGVNDLRKIQKAITDSKHTLPDPDKWETALNDTMDFILGSAPKDAQTTALRAASNIANSVMLKNSGLYQLTDTALAMKEFGMKRVLRAMNDTDWFKLGKLTFDDKDMASRLDAILRGSIQRDTRFRWLSTYADDNLDLTRTSQWFNVTQNIRQASMHVNGMSMVHRFQVNCTSGMVADSLQSMLKGSADETARLERFGLSSELASQLQAAYAKNPGAMLPMHLQMQMEAVGTRMMDYLVQAIRTGETSHFAQFNPVGKLIIGFNSFSVAATNKILRRNYAENGLLGIAHVMAYQYPMMLLAMMAKNAMDGKPAEGGDGRPKVWADAAAGMSVLGGISMIQPLFTGDTPRHSLASMGYVMNALGMAQRVAAGNANLADFTKQVPLVQEFVPTRIIINNFGDE